MRKEDRSSHLKGKSGELEEKLLQAEREIEYYKKLSEEAGKKRLRDVEQLTRLISALRDTEEKLKQSEKRYRSLFENSTAATMVIDEDTTISMVNAQFEVSSGYTRDEVVGKMSWTKLVHPDDLKQMLKYHRERRCAKKEIPKEYEFRFVRKDGEIRDVFIRVDLFPDSNQSIASLLDITSRKKAELALEREKEKFRILVEEFPYGVAVIGRDGTYKYINSKFTQIFGYTLEDVPTGKQWWEKAYPDKEKRKLAKSMWVEDLKHFEPGKVRSRCFSVRCKDGTEKIIDFRGASLHTGDHLMIYEDVTKEKEIEKRLMQAQKMEAIGTLAAGIAHDFNNLLMGIQGRVSLMLMDTPSNHPHFEELGKIEEIVKSATELTSQLLGFARGGKYEVKVADPNSIVEKSFKMFGRTRKEIRIHEKYCGDIWAVEVDAGQIEQVLLNIYINAWQAMPSGGDLYVETSNVYVGTDDSLSYQVEPGRYVKISVTDTGIGMDDDTLQRIFEPFFTTKKKQRGVGLGLASAYGIIRNHGGVIEVFSEKGKGSTFNIYLPASSKERVEEENYCEEVTSGSERILLIDDEEEVLDIGKKMLERIGYKVVVASSGEEGVRLYKEMKDAIDLVILDMVMPKMGGVDTFNALRSVNPNARVLLSSGYSLEKEAQEMLEKGGAGFIQKPFSIEAISKIIRKILNCA